MVVVPPHSHWTLPAYELAFLLRSAGRARPRAGARRAVGRELAVTLVTAEPEPLAAFGAPAGDMIRDEFAASRIELICGRRGTRPERPHRRAPARPPAPRSRVIHLPGTAGPRLAGVPCDPDGFIPVDAGLHVDDDPDVFAIGDGTAGAHKHGGLAAQQADAVAREIARRAGVMVPDEPYRPALRAVVRTGRGPRYLRAAPPGGAGDCAVSDECLWWPPSKVVAPWLVPWLAAFDPADRPRRPVGLTATRRAVVRSLRDRRQRRPRRRTGCTRAADVAPRWRRSGVTTTGLHSSSAIWGWASTSALMRTSRSSSAATSAFGAPR